LRSVHDYAHQCGTDAFATCIIVCTAFLSWLSHFLPTETEAFQRHLVWLHILSTALSCKSPRQSYGAYVAALFSQS
jgi:hypothetical protein